MESRKDQMKMLAERLARLQQAVSEAEKKPISDNDFAKRYLPFSATTLSRIKSTAHPYTGNLDNIADKLAQAEDDVAERLYSVRTAASADREFIQTKVACAAQGAIKRARESKGRRVVVLLAPTGAGKTAVGEALAARGATYIEGRVSWRKSYKAFCADVAKVAGRPMKCKKYSEHDAEERMLQALRARDIVLYLDEANSLGPESANAIKLIVNQTSTVVVIAAIPERWDKFTRFAPDEFGQLINRCQPILRHTGMSDADARPFLAHSGLSAADLDKCLATAVAAANEFGAFKTLVDLDDKLKEIERPTAADVTNYLNYHTKNIAAESKKTVVPAGTKKGVLK
jgi:hypothetical protein